MIRGRLLLLPIILLLSSCTYSKRYHQHGKNVSTVVVTDSNQVNGSITGNGQIYFLGHVLVASGSSVSLDNASVTTRKPGARVSVNYDAPYISITTGKHKVTKKLVMNNTKG